MPDDQTAHLLDLIKKYESGGQNIPNYRYDPTHTAGGYWQITNENWNKFAPQLGIDIKKYPNAMSMEEGDQRRVAEHMLGQENGIHNWSDYNPKLKAALQSEGLLGDTMPQDFGSMTNEQLLELAKKDPNLSKRLVTPDKKITVKPPEKGWLENWATGRQSIPSMIMSPSQGDIKQFTRGAMGYEPPGSEWQDRALDMLRGGERALAPAAIASLLPGGIPAALTSIGLGGVGGKTFETMGRSAAPEISKNPKTQDLIAEGSGLGGAVLAGWGGPKLLRNPAGRAVLGALTAHAMGGGAATDLIVGLLSGGGEYLPGRLGKMFRGARESVTPTDFGTQGKGAPATGKVEPPKAADPGKPLPKTPTEDDMLKTGSLTPEQYVQRMKDMGMDDSMARAKMAHAQKTHLQEAADKAAKQQPPEPRSPVTLKPSPIDQTRTATPAGGTPVNVRTFPGVQVVPNLPVGPPPIGPAATQTPISPALGIQPTPEPTPQIPGTAGPQGLVNAPPSPLQGPPATGTPIAPQINAPPPVNAPPTPAPNLGTVGPLGSMPPRPPLAATVPKSTPLGGMPPTPLETIGKAIADAAVRAKVSIPKSGNLLVRKGIAKKLGLTEIPSKEELTKAAEILADRERASRPTARNP